MIKESNYFLKTVKYIKISQIEISIRAIDMRLSCE